MEIQPDTMAVLVVEGETVQLTAEELAVLTAGLVSHGSRPGAPRSVCVRIYDKITAAVVAATLDAAEGGGIPRETLDMLGEHGARTVEQGRALLSDPTEDN